MLLANKAIILMLALLVGVPVLQAFLSPDGKIGGRGCCCRC